MFPILMLQLHAKRYFPNFYFSGIRKFANWKLLQCLSLRLFKAEFWLLLSKTYITLVVQQAAIKRSRSTRFEYLVNANVQCSHHQSDSPFAHYQLLSSPRHYLPYVLVSLYLVLKILILFLIQQTSFHAFIEHQFHLSKIFFKFCPPFTRSSLTHAYVEINKCWNISTMELSFSVPNFVTIL